MELIDINNAQPAELRKYLLEQFGIEKATNTPREKLVAEILEQEQASGINRDASSAASSEAITGAPTTEQREINASKRVKIRISRDPHSKGNDDVYASVNGVAFIIQREKVAEVPEPVYQVLMQATEMRYEQKDDGTLERWTTAEEFARIRSVRSPADALMLAMGQDLGECVRSGQISPCLAAPIDQTLSALTAAAASCERIKHTPIPFSYTLLLHRTAYMYCFLLPFGLVDTTGFMTPFVVAIVAYTFFGLDALGDEIEEPFGLETNDLPLDTLCRSIEISLLESLGETDLPLPLQPVNFQLT